MVATDPAETRSHFAASGPNPRFGSMSRIAQFVVAASVCACHDVVGASATQVGPPANARTIWSDSVLGSVAATRTRFTAGRPLHDVPTAATASLPSAYTVGFDASELISFRWSADSVVP